MATQAQVSANRKNARKSTGPRTAEGKERAAQNALKHGLRARPAVIPGEDPDEFEVHREQMLAELAPAGAVQGMLAERIVHLSWRLKRAERLENEAFDTLYRQEAVSGYGRTVRAEMAAGVEDQPHLTAQDLIVGRVVVQDCSDGMVLERLLTYERRIEQSLYKAMHELERLQLQRQAHPPAEAQASQNGGPPTSRPATAPAPPTSQSPREPRPAPLSPKEPQEGEGPAEAPPATQTEPREPEAASSGGGDLLRQTKPIEAGETPSIADCRLRIGDSEQDAGEAPEREMSNEANLATVDVGPAGAEDMGDG